MMLWWKRAAIAIIAVTIAVVAGTFVNKPASTPAAVFSQLDQPWKGIYQAESESSRYGRRFETSLWPLPADICAQRAPLNWCGFERVDLFI